MPVSKIPGAGISGGSVTVNQSAPDNSLVINSSGNVGIGTSSPARKLQVKGIVGFEAISGSTNTWENYTFTDNSLRWNYNGAGADEMTIDSSGNVMVGATSVGGVGWSLYGTGNLGYGVTKRSGTGAQAHISFQNDNGQVGFILTNGSNTTYSTTSDYRLKENIAPMTGALAKVQALKPVTYKWKADGSDGQGFIAHELQAVVPDCVTGEKDAVQLVDITDEEGNVIGQEEKPVYQGIDTSFLVATLTAAIQELKAELDATKAEVQALKEAK
jgi:hypothetical protein